MISKYKIFTTVFPAASAAIIVGAPLITWGMEQSHKADHILVHYDDSIISLSNRDAYLNQDFTTVITPVQHSSAHLSLKSIEIWIGDNELSDKQYEKYSTDRGLTIHIVGDYINDRSIIIKAVVLPECQITYKGTDKNIVSPYQTNEIDVHFKVVGYLPEDGFIMVTVQEMDPLDYALVHSDGEFTPSHNYPLIVTKYDQPQEADLNVTLTFLRGLLPPPGPLSARRFDLAFDWVSSISHAGVDDKEEGFTAALV